MYCMCDWAGQHSREQQPNTSSLIELIDEDEQDKADN